MKWSEYSIPRNDGTQKKIPRSCGFATLHLPKVSFPGRDQTLLSDGSVEYRCRRGVLFLGVGEEDTLREHERSPARLGLRVHLGAMVDQILHDTGLPGNNRTVQRRRAAPARIAQNLAAQLILVQRVVEQHV